MNQLEQLECASCGTIFWLTRQRVNNLKSSHHSFFCPNGHSQCFPGQSEEERLREKLLAEMRRNTELQRELDKCNKPKKGGKK